MQQTQPNGGWTPERIDDQMAKLEEIRVQLENIQIQQVRDITDKQNQFANQIEVMQVSMVALLLIVLVQFYMLARKG